MSVKKELEARDILADGFRGFSNGQGEKGIDDGDKAKQLEKLENWQEK